MNKEQLKDFLEAKVIQYNTFDFIEPDPISVPHRYKLKEDIEIAGFLAATIAWGNRTMITKNGHRMMDLMGDSPYDFVMNHDEYQLERLESFVHRTFNSEDFKHFIIALKHIYTNHDGLESIFTKHQTEDSLQPAIQQLHNTFFEIPHLDRTKKHVANPSKGSVSKRINMYLRWMIRNDNEGVDFGLWKSISPAKLSCPLDVHSGNVARKLGILNRKQNDTKALTELDTSLRLLDKEDPVKYDFALFGLGIFEGF
ncbi:TIGR02757 family protein [Flavobacterium ardleyense]|uniref:TIGR02757 family protein n=1 Tax=Flavobacterium ardleyense TaxID=2038737 RepID=UPI00298D41A4|nr:TIGR02757 family protein [Flavobacterium ardleyense]